MRKQLKFGEEYVVSDTEVKVSNTEVNEQNNVSLPHSISLSSLPSLKYNDIVLNLESCLRELDSRLEKAHSVLPELQKLGSTLEYIQAHALYRTLLWQWQRARLALLMLRLEHPNYNTDALVQIENEKFSMEV